MSAVSKIDHLCSGVEVLGQVLNVPQKGKHSESDFVFSVTRRSRSDSCHLLRYSVTPLLIVSTDLTDVTLVSDDTY